MQKYTKAEAGKLGGEKSKIITAIKQKQRINEYLKDAKQCKCCNKMLAYTDRKKTFCNSSCSATYNNLRKDARKIPKLWNCSNCNKEHATIAWRVGMYCNNECQHSYQNKERTRQWLEEGKDWKIQVPGWAKRYLIEQRGYACEICELSTWLENDITLECDHIDGNHTNNVPLNLRLLCPNCHSQTPTYKAKNIGNGRASRRVV